MREGAQKGKKKKKKRKKIRKKIRGEVAFLIKIQNPQNKKYPSKWGALVNSRVVHPYDEMPCNVIQKEGGRKQKEESFLYCY